MPQPTASRPFWLNASDDAGRFIVHSFSTPHVRASHVFRLPSRPAVANECPADDGSYASACTGPRCASSLACGCDTFGDHSVTVPL